MTKKIHNRNHLKSSENAPSKSKKTTTQNSDGIPLMRHQVNHNPESREHLLYTLMHSSPFPISITRISDGTFIEINEAFLEVCGYTRNEVLGHSSRELDLWKNPEQRDELLHLLSTRKKVKGYKSIMKAKDGTIRHALFNLELISFEGESSILCMGKDITEEERVEEELKHLHEIYRHAIETTQGVPYRFIFSDEMYEFFGEGCRDLLGIEPQKMTLAEFEGIIEEISITEPSDCQNLVDCLRSFQKGTIDSYKADLKIKTPDSDVRWISDCGVPLRDKESGKITGFIGILHDITQRKKAEEGLKHIHSIYRIAIENARGVPYMFYNNEDRYYYLGEGWEDLIGISREETTRQKVCKCIRETVITEPGAPSDIEEYKAAFQRGECARYRADLKIHMPRGEEKWLSDFSVPIYDDTSHKVIGSLGILQDITDRKQVEKRTEAFATLGQKLNAVNNPREAAHVIVDTASILFNYDAFYLDLYVEEEGRFYPLIDIDTIDGEKIETCPPFESTEPTPLFKLTLREGAQLLLRETEEEYQELKLIPFGNTGRKSASLMFAPVRKGDKTLGLLSIQSYTPNAYTPEDLKLLQFLADHCGGAIDRTFARADLFYSEVRLRLLTEQIPTILWTTDKDLRCTRLLGAGLKSFNYEANELVGRSIHDFFDNDDKESPAIEKHKHALQGIPVSFETEVHGRVFSCHLEPLRDTNGNITGCIGVANDVTQRIESEQELKRIHHIYREVIEQTNGIPYVLNHSTLTYDFIGERCEDILGIPASELTHKKLREMVDDIVITDLDAPQNPEEYIKAFVQKDLQIYRADIKITTPQGEEKWLSDCSVLIQDDGTQTAMRSIGILHDITDRKRAEEQRARHAENKIQRQTALTLIAKSDFDTLENALAAITEISSRTLGVERVSVWLFNNEKTILECKDLFVLSKGMHVPEKSLISSHYPHYFEELETCRTIDAHNAVSDPRTAEFAQNYLIPLNISSMLDAPIRSNGKMVGTICHEHTGPLRHWTPEEKDFCSSLADLISLNLESFERKRSEDELKRTHDIYRRVIENADCVPYHLLYSDNKYAFIGEGIEDLVGISPDELNFTNFHDLIEEIVVNDPGVISDPKEYGKLFKQGKLNRYRVDLRIRTFHNQTKWINDCSVPFRDERTGEVIGALGILQDITYRKKIEQELSEKEAHLRLILEQMPAFVWTTDNKLNSISVLGRESITSENEAKPSFSIALHEKFREKPSDSILVKNTQLALKGEPVSFTQTWEGRVYQTHIEPLFDESRNIIGTIGIALDISNLKRAEEEVRKLSQFLDLVIDNANVWLDVLDKNRNVVIWNKAAERISGYKREEVLGYSKIWEWLYPDEEYRSTITSLASAIIKGNMVEDLETRIRTKDGDYKLISWHSRNIVNENGETIGSVALGRDITDRKQAEEALRESEKKYRTLFEESRDVVFMSSYDGKLLDINPSGVKLLGYNSREEMLNLDLIHEVYTSPVDRERLTGVIAKDGFIKDYEVSYKGKDGKKLTGQVTASALRDDKGNIIGYRGILRDVTEQKELEQQLFQAQKLESIGTLAGGIAHDFNNILGGILGYASLLKMKIKPEDPVFNYIDAIEKGSLRAAELTAQLLAFARGGMSRTSPLNLNTVVKDTLKIIGETFDKSIKITTNLHEDLSTVEVDPGQIEQVVMNLCVNARDAMEDGGTLSIETGVAYVSHDIGRKYMGAVPGWYVTLSVSDTGVGMEQKILTRIFEPFFTTKDQGRGTGLGLSLAFGVAKNHGGFIHVDSEPGKGSTFKVYLPVSKKVLSQESAPENIPEGGGELILIIDDEELICNLVKDILEQHGYRTVIALNGEEALHLFSRYEDEISGIILDLIMPGINGFEVCREFNKINPDIPILVSTGYSQDSKANELLKNGMNSFIQKPYQVHQLLWKVEDILKKRKKKV